MRTFSLDRFNTAVIMHINAGKTYHIFAGAKRTIYLPKTREKNKLLIAYFDLDR